MSVQRLADLMRLLGLVPADEDILDVLLLARLVGAPAPAVAGTAEEGGWEPRPAAWTREPDKPAVQTIQREQDSEPRRPERGFGVPEDAEVTHSLHPIGAGAAAGTQRATLVRAPAAPALGDKLALGRALRPMKRTIPSRRQRYMDEVATANRIAEDGLWTPVLRPAR